MSVTDFLEPVGRPGPQTLPQAFDWMQGRTFYGGASALIAYTAAIRAFPDLAPLRGVQVAFVAPIGETLETRAQIVRQGRNVTQVRSEIMVDGKVALTAFFLFGAAREPNARHPAQIAEHFAPLSDAADTVMVDKGPTFIRNHFELRKVPETNSEGPPMVRRWLRLKGDHDLDPISELILVGDTLPPGAMRAMERPGPISSINWSFNILDAAPSSAGGWWLAETASQWADHGFSSERLRLWNAEGQLILDGMQLAAVFG